MDGFRDTVVVSICEECRIRSVGSSTFFRVGPHADLVIFGITIDTGGKYVLVLSYTLMSTVVRTLQQEVLRPWVIQKIQNDKPQPQDVLDLAYRVVSVEILFIWFDWFMYLNILLAQIDLMIIEMIGNVATAGFTTHAYLQRKRALPLS
jgi:hypothetical protein